MLMGERMDSIGSEQIEEIPFGKLFAEPTRNGLTRPKSVRGAGTKMVNMGELFAHPRINDAPMDRVPLSESEEKRFLLNERDLLFARQSLVLEGAGKCSIFLHDDERVTFESHVTRVRLDPLQANPLFYFYYFQSQSGKAAIRSIVEQGAGASGIRGSDLGKLSIQWLPLKIQNAAAEVLGVLDDKIELNRKMNETLEAMARALFKSWFVDFDPVRAKAKGRDTGLPAHIAALFPDSFEDSELGELPRAWSVKTIGDLATVQGGSTPSTKEPAFWEDGIHCWTTPKDLSSLHTPALLGTERRITDAGLTQISSGLLPAGTVLLSSRAPIGYLAVAEVPVAVNQGFIAMRPKNNISNLFLLWWAGTAHDDILARANGSTFLEISKSNFRPIPVVTPPPPVMQAFDKLVRPFYERIVLSERETQSLSTIRDMLLPKLISGELQIAETEHVL